MALGCDSAIEGARLETELVVEPRRRGPRRIGPSWIGNGYCDSSEGVTGEFRTSEDERIPGVFIVVTLLSHAVLPSRQSTQSTGYVYSLASTQHMYLDRR